MGSVFGRFIHGGHIEQAVTATLKLWLRDYLAEVDREATDHQGPYPPIVAWEGGPGDLESYLDKIGSRAPAVIVRELGTDSTRPDGDGVYEATWPVDVTVVVNARDQQAAEQTARVYGAAIRLLAQKPSLGDFAVETRWLGEEPETLGDRDRRFAAVTGHYTVTVENVLTAPAGPATPSDPPEDPGDHPQMTTFDPDTEPVTEPRNR